MTAASCDTEKVAQPQGEAPFRMSGASAFTRIFEGGRRYKGQFVQVLLHTASPVSQPHTKYPPTPTHYGIVVGRKALPRAVDRNRFKRKLRVCLRRWREALDGYDVLVCARPSGFLTRDTIDAAVAEAELLLARSLTGKSKSTAPLTQ